MQMWSGWYNAPVLSSVELITLEWREAAFCLFVYSVWVMRPDSNSAFHQTSLCQTACHPVSRPLFSRSTTENKYGGTHRIPRGSTTSLTLTLPLWSLNLNWLNELPIWEALVTAYWCVQAYLHKCVGVCEYWWQDPVSSCLLLFIQSASLHFCQTPAYSQSTPKFNKLLCRHWSFSHTNICIKKKNSGLTRSWWDGAVCSF